MKERFVSIIIPAYNAEKYIKDTISSVLNQTYPYFEIIVVDDASTDNTAEVVRSIKDKRLRLLQHNKNMGPGGARNTGIENARGRWIAELDSDDQWLPSRLEKLLTILNSLGDGYFIADNQLMCFDSSKGLKSWTSSSEFYKIYFDNSFLDVNLSEFLNIGAPTICPIIPLEFIRDNNIKYNPFCFFGEDLEFYCQILLHGLKLRLCREPLYLRRLRPGSLTTKNKDDLIEVIHRLLSERRLKSDEKKGLNIMLQKIKTQQQINDFLHLLNNKEWVKALNQLFSKPSLILDCLQRIPRIPLFLSYYLSVKRVGGKMRF